MKHLLAGLILCCGAKAYPEEVLWTGLNGVHIVAVSPEGKSIAAADARKKIHVWNLASGITEEIADLDGVTRHLHFLDEDLIVICFARKEPISFNPLKERVFTTCRIVRISTKQTVTEHETNGNLLSFSMESRILALRHPQDSPNLVIWSLGSPKAKRLGEIKVSGSLVIAAALSPNGLRVVTASIEERVRVTECWDLKGEKIWHLAKLGFDSLSISDCGKFVVGYDNLTRHSYFMDIADGQEVLPKIFGDLPAKFRSDGREVFSVSDGLLRRKVEEGSPIFTVPFREVPRWAPTDMSVSRSRNVLAIGGRTGVVRVFTTLE